MNKYEHVDDNYATPPDLYNELDKEFNFDFDPCPYNEDPITTETDGLLKEWGQSNYINPPYSKAAKLAFVNKAVQESKKGKTCVMLLPVVTSSALFHDVIKPNAKEIRFVKGRIKFYKKCPYTGEFKPGENHGRHDSMIVVF